MHDRPFSTARSGRRGSLTIVVGPLSRRRPGLGHEPVAAHMRLLATGPLENPLGGGACETRAVWVFFQDAFPGLLGPLIVAHIDPQNRPRRIDAFWNDDVFLPRQGVEQF